ncbi:hypothetical protein PF011_g16040 [Phytophthora fragariae]|uniref:Cyclic nucleotide-binding domain-containing protein n=1 Tax=Phytophthora fragariae TaxID=53985 RepID=A0A6A3JWQ5_9STRA|nr:hypothetical protein PF011_g16040 [Phytophthora fragariae]
MWIDPLLQLQLFALLVTCSKGIRTLHDQPDPATTVSPNYDVFREIAGGLHRINSAGTNVMASMFIAPELAGSSSTRRFELPRSSRDSPSTHLAFNCTATSALWNLEQDANVLKLDTFETVSDNSDGSGTPNSVAVATLSVANCQEVLQSSVGRVVFGDSFFGDSFATFPAYFHVLTALNDTDSRNSSSVTSPRESCRVRLELARASFAQLYPDCRIKFHSTDMANLIRTESDAPAQQARRALEASTFGFVKDASCKYNCGEEGGDAGEIDVDKCWAKVDSAWTEVQCKLQFYAQNSGCTTECGYEGDSETLPANQCYDCSSGDGSCASGYTSTDDGCCRVLSCEAVEDTTIGTLSWNLEDDAVTVSNSSYPIFETGNCSDTSNPATDCCRITCENCFLNVSIASMFADLEIVGLSFEEAIEMELTGNANLQVALYAPNGCTLDETTQLKNASFTIPLGETGISVEITMGLDLRRKLSLQPHGSTVTVGATTELQSLTAGSFRSEKFHDVQVTTNTSSKLAQSSIDLEMELDLTPSFQASLSLLKGLAKVGIKTEFVVFVELNSSFRYPDPFPGLSSKYLDDASLWHGGNCQLPHFVEYNCNAGYGEVNVSIPLSVAVSRALNTTTELNILTSSDRSSFSLFSGCVATAYDAEVLLSTAIGAVSSLSDEKLDALRTILVWTLGMTDIDPEFVNISNVSTATGSSNREGHTSSAPNIPVKRSSSAKQLTSSWSTRKLRQNSASSRGFNTKIAANDTNKSETPEVVTNYVYDVPEKKPKPKTPGADYDDHDDLENDDFDHGLDDEEESDEDDVEFRPFMSEDEDEMAHFAHRMGGPDFKLLRRRVLHPHGRIRSIWDTIALALTTWVLVIVPFELCFPMREPLRRSILHLDLFVDSLFVVDIALNFNTAVEDDGKLHFSYPSILRSYTRGWFVLEVLWTLPFYAVFEGHDPGAYDDRVGSSESPLFHFAAQASWLYPTARCLHLMRVVGLPRLQRRLEHSLLISSKVSSLGSFLFVVLALSHVFSCVFAYLAFNDQDQLEFALGSRVLQDSEVKTRYIAAFYWSMMTMTTVGYGDITVKTNAGRLFSIAAMVVGAGVFAYGITNVVSLFQQLYESDTAYRRDMDQINDFMQARMLPRALRDKVRANTFHWRKAARGENKERDRAIVKRMASFIRAKVVDRFCEDMMPHKMPFLAGCSAEFIHDLYLRMRVQCYLPGEDIISQGDYGSEMYFLFVGHAQVLLGLTKVALFGPNSYFGEFSIANPRKPRLATIQALDFCETHCIDREQILRLLLSHPITMRSARQLANLRSRKALTLVYESGGKSRTLLQGLAMMWRSEGIQAVLPADVSADSLPFLQEFTASPAAAPQFARRGSVSGSILLPAGTFISPQPDSASLAQLQQYYSSVGSSGVSAPALVGANSSSSLTVDTSHSLAATQGLSLTPSHQRVRNETLKLPKIMLDRLSETGISSVDKDANTARKMVGTIASIRRASLKRRGSTTSITIGSPLVVLPPSPAAAPSPQGDVLDQLLTEIRNVASRQNMLEQQLKAMLASAYPKPETPLIPAHKLDSGTIALERGRFDEQHWINAHAPPLTRDRGSRHVDRLLHPGGEGI